MLRKTSLLFIVVIGIFFIASCSKKDTAANKKDSWKIGIMTGTVSQSEEEYRAAQAVLEKYGEDHVIIQTYPDQFMREQETVIQNVVVMAQDPAVKAIVICQAIPGSAAAIDKCKEIRDDLLFIVGSVAEDPKLISSKADICLQPDELGMGTEVPRQAQKLGAEKFVHYSFPRHMSYALLSKRRDIFKEECKKLGMEFIDATAPDPTGDAGITGAQQFILEDVPRKVEQYGNNTNFFSTNCSMMEPLIRSVINTKSVFAQQCCPSPYHGYPGALGIKIPEDKKGDVNYIRQEITDKIKGAGNENRMSTWPVPVQMMFIESGSQYAAEWAKGNIDKKVDLEKMSEYFKEYAGTEMKITPYTDEETNTTYDNYLLVLSDFITF